MVRHLKNNRGQTVLEYIMLLAVAFITTFIMMTGPIGSFVNNFVAAMQNNMQNFIKNSEWGPDEISIGSPEHPSAEERLKPLHFESGVILYEKSTENKAA